MPIPFFSTVFQGPIFSKKVVYTGYTASSDPGNSEFRFLFWVFCRTISEDYFKKKNPRSLA